jgi:serine/threonine-protein kinase
MSLAPGARLGTYEVVAKTGAGGMGEVYRGRDTELKREVAIKVLTSGVASDPDRLARFRREAEVLAALNHPHIAQIYAVESTVAGPALVMEFVDGLTLDERFGGRALPWDEALAITRQIASALESAHESGIVHRDLKPANIKITDEGVVKVLDFGLAKAAAPEAAAVTSDAATSPTLTARATTLGMILGTAAYMAPEQAKGRPVDRRADIWAFGAVLFEMLTGRRAFEGDDVSEVLAAVIRGEPPWEALPEDLPPPVRRLVRRCLEKDPRRRLRDIAEGLLQLDEALAVQTTVAPVRAAPPTRPLWRRVVPVAIAIIVTAIVTLATYELMNRGLQRSGPVRFSTTVSNLSLSANPRPHIAIASGDRIIYRGRDGLFLKDLNKFDGVRVEGTTEADTTPLVSPDGEWLGFIQGEAQDNRLFKVPIGGGPRTPIAVSPQRIYGVDWGPDDTIVFGTPDGLYKVPGSGGKPVALTTAADKVGGWHKWPSFVGSSGLVLFAIGQNVDSKLAAVSLAGGPVTELGVTGTSPRYLPTGHLLYVTGDGVLRAAPFDIRRLAVTGSAVPVESDVRVRPVAGSADFDVSDSGTLVYIVGDSVARTLVWVDRKGVESPIPAEPRAYSYPRLSSDGLQLVVGAQQEGREQDLWLWEFARPGLRALVRNIGTGATETVRARDGSIFFALLQNNRQTIQQMKADGSGRPELIVESEAVLRPHAAVPDGSALIVRHGSDVALVKLAGERQILPLVKNADNAALSPNGAWLAYDSTKSGRREVYVRPFPRVDDTEWPISSGDGWMPVWSRKGDELFYIRDDELMSVAIDGGSGFSFQPPKVLFRTGGFANFGLGRHFDIGPDGRFLFTKRVEQPEPAVRVVLHWIDEVAARVKQR